MSFKLKEYFPLKISALGMCILLCTFFQFSFSLNIINVNIESLSAGEDKHDRNQFSTKENVENDDIQQIKKNLPDFQRPVFKQIPYVVQRVNIESGITDYLLPPEEPGQTVAQIAFSRHSLDTHLSVLVFPTGRYKWRLTVERKYVVLRRHSKKTPVYFLTYAFVRQTGNQRFVEWSVEELSPHPPLTKVEQEICRAETCDIPEWILGTCTIVSNKCSITLDKFENETIYRQLKTEEMDEIGDANQHPNFKDESSSSESDENYPTNPFSSVFSSGKRRKRSLYNKNVMIIPSDPQSPDRVPSSLDLLFLKMPNENRPKRYDYFNSYISIHGIEDLNQGLHEGGGPGQSQSQTRLRRSKRSPSHSEHDHNIEEILHILKCKNCQKLGNFYEDLQEEVAFNRVMGLKFSAQFNTSQGKHYPWHKFPWIKRSSNKPYIGYGDCNSIAMAPDLKMPISNEMDDVIEFYLDTLRLECKTVLKNEIRGWLTSKMRFLRIVQDLSFEIIPSSKLIKYSMLSQQEFEMLMSGILFFKYSSVYREASASVSKSPLKLNLLGHPLSAKVSFLTKVLIKVIDCANRYLQHHMIKISRTLARNLKDKFYALMLEKRFIKSKKSGVQAHLNKENYRDRIQIMALKEFLLYGLSPIFRSGTKTEIAFKSFYELNENRIRFLVHSYGLDSTQDKSG